MTAASCCATFYEQDWVQLLLGDSFHPGGLELTHRAIDALRLAPNARVLDLACGIGSTSLELGRAGHTVTGFDASDLNLQRARKAAEHEGLGARLEFVGGDATDLPFEDDTFDAVMIECAVSTFAAKIDAASEVARVLRGGGRLAMSDMVRNEPLPATLLAFAGPWACLEDALTVEAYQRLFLDAGLGVVEWVDESAALDSLALQMKRKLALAGLGTMSGLIEGLPFELREARDALRQGRALVARGAVQYCRLMFSNGVPSFHPHETSSEAAATLCDPSTGCC